MAFEKCTVPANLTSLCAFFAFTNQYSSFVENYSGVSARLQEGLNLFKGDGKAETHIKLAWGGIQNQVFQVLSELIIQRVNQHRPFVYISSYVV